jgi:hypothetical protein
MSVPRDARRWRNLLRSALAIALPPLSLALLVSATAPSVGCRGAEVRVPPRLADEPASSDWMCVDYPPPAAKVEELPTPPNASSVWVDGEWRWSRKRWSWRPGGWLEPAGGARYLRSAVVRLPNGALTWHSGHWHVDVGDGGADSIGEASTSPAASASASPSTFASVALRCRRPASPARESAPSSSVGVDSDAGPSPVDASGARRPRTNDDAPDAADAASAADAADAADAARALIQPPP